MNAEVTTFIETIQEPWQRELCAGLRETVRGAVPDVQERIQYKKPHFLKNGKYAAVIGTSKDAVSFTIFNAAGLELPAGRFDGPPERKTMKLKRGDAFDAAQLTALVGQAAAGL
ncbi:DUF1801 domain-containing protein [Paenibacillus sp. MWE-103]|uniref:DUF1801 domain-containing protein n=1 Tax=Paenibacillus artemisiicola TaxID=1172618 RepID=A0ABS3WJU8_9BACL|nr:MULTISPECIES: DUF1801 domain-containing protein [Paenibacillus]MBO7748361.1 DUF1801 domain-containing protein [Paenibacillus artemisiicola]SFI79517.1 hypothetical protein SAMN02799624_02225 [Paenibacillus sp. UNC496MF]